MSRVSAVALSVLMVLSVVAVGTATASVTGDTSTPDGVVTSGAPATLNSSVENGSTTNATQEERKEDLPYVEQIANNSALQVEERQDLEPIPEPTDPPEYEILPEEVTILRHNPDTGETTSTTVEHTYDDENQTASPFPGQLADHPAIGGGPDEMPAGEQLTIGSVNSASRTSVISPDDRQRITATSTYPWRTVVHLRIAFPGGTGPCSGAIIDEYHVITAGHCVYNNNFGGWANNVTVTPGRDNNVRPFHIADTTQIRTYKRWRDNGDHRYDLAILTLDRSVGKFTGWMGRWSPSKGHPVYTTTLNNAGHPADLGSNRMWWDADSGNRSNDLKHFYEMDTAGGSSGSPVWVYDWFNRNERYQLTVHAYGIGGGLNPNSGTRLDNNKFNDIERVRQADDEIRPPTDKPDLVDDGIKWATVDKTTVTAGTDLRISTDVRNIGTATSGPSKVVYYASSDKRLSSSDTEIGTASVGSINPFQYADAVFDGTVPSDLDAGDYYICWEVDGRMDVDEFRESNNGGCLNSQVTVEEPEPIDPGRYSVDVDFSNLPAGLQRYNITYQLSEGAVITDVRAGAIGGQNFEVVAGGVDSNYVTVRAVDEENVVGEGDQSASLFSLTVQSDTEFTGRLSPNELTDDAGEPIDSERLRTAVSPAGGVGVSIAPTPITAGLETTKTVDVQVTGVTDGVGSYELLISTSDTSTARIVDAADRIGGSGRIERAEDGASVRIGAFAGDTSDTGTVTVATVTVAGVNTGTADLSVEVDSVSDEAGSQYDLVATTDLATVTVREQPRAPEVIAGTPATDPDTDGVYEDVNGDGEVNPGDATVLFNAIFEGNEAVTNNPAAFDINDDGSVTAGDATVLFDEAFGG